MILLATEVFPIFRTMLSLVSVECCFKVPFLILWCHVIRSGVLRSAEPMALNLIIKYSLDERIQRRTI